MDEGNCVALPEVFKRIWRGNATRLLTWASVGADHENGLWCIYGARLGLLAACDPELDITNIADYGWFEKFWEMTTAPFLLGDQTNDRLCPYSGFGWDTTRLAAAIQLQGDRIHAATGVHIPLFDPAQSVFLKQLRGIGEQPTPRLLFRE